MKHSLSVSAFCSALLFCVSAIPCRAGTIDLLNTTDAGTSDISIAPGSTVPSPPADTVIGLTDNFASEIISVGGPMDGPETNFLNEYYCGTAAQCTDAGIPQADLGDILVTGTLAGVTASSFTAPLVQIDLTGALTGNTTTAPPSANNSFTLIFPTGLVGTITVNPAVLSALGLSPSTIFSLTVLANVDTGGGGGSYNAPIQTAEIKLTTVSGTTPEPSTWLLTTLGVSLIVIAARRRVTDTGTRP